MKIAAFRSSLRAGAAGMALCLLGACANMAQTPPGTPISQVEAKFGQPNYSCPLPDGGRRMIWTMQPFGQHAWGTNVGADGRTDKIVPLLTDQHFEVLRQGTWTPQQVLCEFGPPAEKDGVGLPGEIKIVWSYRYLQSGVWNSLMYVYFGVDGSYVTRFHPGPDPMYEERRFPFF